MRVFVSYRRSDSKDFAARLADRLGSLLEVKSVFFDVESIAFGEHFPHRLEQEIDRSDVVVAVIGPAWRGPEGGENRIAADGDFVRAEIARALQKGKRVIPVLVDDAPMPTASDLPADIADLAERNALSFRHTSFRQDFDMLAEAMLGRKPARKAAGMRLALGASWRAALGLYLFTMLALAVAVMGVINFDMPLETILGGRIQLVIFLLLLFAAFQYWTFRYLRRNLD